MRQIAHALSDPRKFIIMMKKVISDSEGQASVPSHGVSQSPRNIPETLEQLPQVNQVYNNLVLEIRIPCYYDYNHDLNSRNNVPKYPNYTYDYHVNRNVHTLMF